MRHAPPTWLTDALDGQVAAIDHADEVLLLHVPAGEVEVAVEVFPSRTGHEALTTAGDLGFAYRSEGAATDHERAAEVCRRVADRLGPRGREVIELVATLGAAGADAASAGEVVIVYEDHLVAAAADPADAARALCLAGEPERLERVQLHLDWDCGLSCVFCKYALDRDALGSGARDEARVAWHGRGPGVVDALEAILSILREQSPPGELLVFGYDFLTHPALDAILRVLERETEVRVSLMGPLADLEEPALAARIAALPTLDQLRFSLVLSLDPATHDAVVGQPGHQARVMAALEALGTLGAPVTATVLVTAETLPGLPALLERLAEWEVPVTVTAFQPEALDPQGDHAWDLPRLAVSPDAMRATLEAVPDAHLGALESLPFCSVPPRLRWAQYRRPVSPGAVPDVFPPACDRCRHRAHCVGVTWAVQQVFGDGCVRPE